MATPQQNKDALMSQFLTQPGTYSLVTGIGVGKAPGFNLPEQVLVLVESASNCDLQKLWGQINTVLNGDPFQLLITGRFTGLSATGESIGVYAPFRYNVPPVSAGTFGAIAETSGQKFLLSSNHVLAFNGRATGAAVTTPGTLDQPGGGVTIATVSAFVELQPAAFPPWTPGVGPAPVRNTVDCALAELNAAGLASISTPTPPSPVTVLAPAGTGLVAVMKKGRTTGPTNSTVCIWSVSAYVDVSFATVFMEDLMGTFGLRPGGPGTIRQDAFAAYGDSGSLVLTDPGGQGLGLVFARSYCSGVFAAAGVPLPPPGLFQGYIVLLCSLATVQTELASQVGALTFSV
jgi:hypothetical protein